MVKFWSVIKWENWILHFAANFCNLQQLCCMLLALLKMQKHGFKKFVLRNLFYVYQKILFSFNRETINTFGQDTVVFPMKQQLCSNFNFLKITCSTEGAEAIFCVPFEFFSNFQTNLTITNYLLHIACYIAANLQQICYSMIFFWKMEVTSCSRIVPSSFLENLVWFYQK